MKIFDWIMLEVMNDTLRAGFLLLLAGVMVVGNGCVGMAHSGCVCCSDLPGKYYRSTRVDLKFIRESPHLTPIILALDLPFAIVCETLEAPWIRFGGHDPRPRLNEANPPLVPGPKAAPHSQRISGLGVSRQSEEPSNLLPHNKASATKAGESTWTP